LQCPYIPLIDILLILRYRDESLAVSLHHLTLTLQLKVMFLVEIDGDLVRLSLTNNKPNQF